MALTPEACEQRTILKILAGSHIHGLQAETSDQDFEAIVIEPLSEAVGLGQPWEETERIGQKDAHGHKIADTKWFSLRKWCRMAAKGNPNFLLMLFAPSTHLIRHDARGSDLRDMKEAFLSKQAIKPHLGYMQGQRSRMVNHQRAFAEANLSSNEVAVKFGAGHGRGLPRFELIEKYGYDTKFAMHLLRLGYQGLELAKLGKITLPIVEEDRQLLLKVRRGEFDLPWVLKWADDLEAAMKAAFDASTLPEHPDYATIESWMQLTYIRTWTAERRLQDTIEDQTIFGVDPNYGRVQ